MEYEVRLEQQRKQPLVVVRRQAKVAELPRVVPEACGAVWNAVGVQKIEGAGRHVALYLDDVINLQVGVEVPKPFAGEGEVFGSELPAGKVATTTHYGAYQQLYKAHDAVREWCKKNGRKITGPNWEIYGHWEEEWNKDPTKIRTDVFYLVG
jgi:effector-binding domain-containing protein